MERALGWIFAAMMAVSLVLMAACAPMKTARNEAGTNEVKLSIDDVPLAVRTSILREAAGKPIEEIEQGGSGGQAVYEAEFDDNGREVEVKVAIDGTVLSREVEEEDDMDDVEERDD